MKILTPKNPINKYIIEELELPDDGDDIIFNSQPLKLPLVTTEQKNFDLIKIDLGNGKFTLAPKDFKYSDLYRISCILLVDESLLDQVYYIDSGTWNNIGNAMDLGYPDFINTLSSSNQDYLYTDGTILIPIKPVEYLETHRGIEFDEKTQPQAPIYTKLRLSQDIFRNKNI